MEIDSETIPYHKFPQTEHKNRKTIAVVGSLSRIGTTTQCLQIVKYFQSCGKKACYIEFNNTGFLNALKKYYTDIQEKENMEHIKPEKKLSLQLPYRIVEQQVQEI